MLRSRDFSLSQVLDPPWPRVQILGRRDCLITRSRDTVFSRQREIRAQLPVTRGGERRELGRVRAAKEETEMRTVGTLQRRVGIGAVPRRLRPPRLHSSCCRVVHDRRPSLRPRRSTSAATARALHRPTASTATRTSGGSTATQAPRTRTTSRATRFRIARLSPTSPPRLPSRSRSATTSSIRGSTHSTT